MPTIPQNGTFIPNYLNNCNSPSSTGQQGGAAGEINYPSGLNAGKLIEMSLAEAQALQLPNASGVELFEGAYQWVKVDSGATASECTAGLAAFQKLPASGTDPANALSAVVTGESGAQAKSQFAGVFLNPNGVTPGNWCFIFVGQGRVQVTFKSSLTNGGPAVGDVIACGGTGGKFDDSGAASSGLTGLSVGYAEDFPPVANGTSPIWIRTLIGRITPTAPGS